MAEQRIMARHGLTTHVKTPFDGDMLSLSLVFSDEAVAEVDERLNDPSSYLAPSGGLTYKTTTDVTEWVLRSLTHPIK